MSDMLSHIKRDYMDGILSFNIEEIKSEVEKDEETITLYHGTTTNRLNAILQKGILPRKETKIDNWKWDGNEKSSIETVVYMTNKWHYFYATNALGVLINERGGIQGKSNGPIPLPCYLECKVPKSLLVMDEDFIQTKFMEEKVKDSIKKQKDLVFDPFECLEQYGTVGVIGGVSPSMINSFTVLGGGDLFKYITDEESPYNKEWYNWQLGMGKGKITLKQMLEKEAESAMNGRWQINEVKKNTFLSFGVKPNTGKITLVQTKIL